MTENEKYQCPKCGGECWKVATTHSVKWNRELEKYELFSDRICSVCGHEWITNDTETWRVEISNR